MPGLARELPPLPGEILGQLDAVVLHPAAKATSSARQLRRLYTLLTEELEILTRIKYKQKNQHRSATWWRHLLGTHRVVHRFLREFEGNLVPHLPDVAPDSRITAKRAVLPRLIEASLRLLVLQESAVSVNFKAFSAVEQLLRASLFMPLALSVKAVVARLDGLLKLTAKYLGQLLQAIDETAKRKNSNLNLPTMLTKLPKELRRRYDSINASGDTILDTGPGQRCSFPTRIESGSKGDPAAKLSQSDAASSTLRKTSTETASNQGNKPPLSVLPSTATSSVSTRGYTPNLSKETVMPALSKTIPRKRALPDTKQDLGTEEMPVRSSKSSEKTRHITSVAPDVSSSTSAVSLPQPLPLATCVAATNTLSLATSTTSGAKPKKRKKLAKGGSKKDDDDIDAIFAGL